MRRDLVGACDVDRLTDEAAVGRQVDDVGVAEGGDDLVEDGLLDAGGGAGVEAAEVGRAAGKTRVVGAEDQGCDTDGVTDVVLVRTGAGRAVGRGVGVKAMLTVAVPPAGMVRLVG